MADVAKKFADNLLIRELEVPSQGLEISVPRSLDLSDDSLIAFDDSLNLGQALDANFDLLQRGSNSANDLHGRLDLDNGVGGTGGADDSNGRFGFLGPDSFDITGLDGAGSAGEQRLLGIGDFGQSAPQDGGLSEFQNLLNQRQSQTATSSSSQNGDPWDLSDIGFDDGGQSQPRGADPWDLSDIEFDSGQSKDPDYILDELPEPTPPPLPPNPYDEPEDPDYILDELPEPTPPPLPPYPDDEEAGMPNPIDDFAPVGGGNISDIFARNAGTTTPLPIEIDTGGLTGGDISDIFTQGARNPSTTTPLPFDIDTGGLTGGDISVLFAQGARNPGTTTPLPIESYSGPSGDGPAVIDVDLGEKFASLGDLDDGFEGLI